MPKPDAGDDASADEITHIPLGQTQFACDGGVVEKWFGANITAAVFHFLVFAY